MEIQIQDLVQSIKRDGIEEAQKQAQAIIAQAKSEAEQIIAASKVEAAKNIENAKREIESSKALVLQAERDAVLSVKKSIGEILDRILATKVDSTLTEASLSKLIKAALGSDDPAYYALEIDEARSAVKAELAEMVKKGLEIRPVKGGALKLVCKDGSGFYDLSNEEIVGLLKPFLGDMQI